MNFVIVIQIFVLPVSTAPKFFCPFLWCEEKIEFNKLSEHLSKKHKSYLTSMKSDIVEVNFFQKHLLLHQLTYNMTKDSLLPESQIQYMKIASSEHAQNMLRACCVHKFFLKFIYSEKTTKFCKISTNYLTGST